ncbi:DUF4397 domain-containing protein [Chitinophaga silvatica]|uniref:DUF4397 domain-containing protein n=1 Tax=Chitinophaga silvatica TaxID=2282649 RepID=A0A3E1YHT2_9BACT|nr:DUF4397 domain-containing protein [Chitinophaga silvatica]RFS27005.1 DUF4397 domain-containing protein [Chitinophaga silvatica]
MQKRIILLIGLAFGCKKAEYLDINAQDRSALSANIRFVNARVPNTGIQFWTFTQQITTTPLLPGNSSDYRPTTFGNVQINFTEGNGTAYIASRQFGNSATYSATGGPNGPIAGYYHTVIAAASRNDVSKDSLILFYDDLSTPPAGKAKIRLIHLAYGIGAISANIFQNGKENKLSDSIPYGSASGSNILGKAYDSAPFSVIDAGKISVGITNKASNTPILINTLQDIQLEAGKIYTIFLLTNGKGIVSANIL